MEVINRQLLLLFLHIKLSILLLEKKIGKKELPTLYNFFSSFYCMSNNFLKRFHWI